MSANKLENADSTMWDFSDISKSDVEMLDKVLKHCMSEEKSFRVAYELIRRYRNLSNVMSANIYELMLHKDIKEQQAVYIKTLFEIFQRIEKGDPLKMRYKTFESVGEMFVKEFKYVKTEIMMAVGFSKTGKVIRKVDFTSHDVNFANVDCKQIALLASSCKSGFIAVAHNHPSGILTPSIDDRRITADIMQLLCCMEVKFMDHYIVSKDKYIGILANEDKIRIR